MIKELGVTCKLCLNILTVDRKECECGNVCIRGLDFHDNGVVLYVDDINTVDLVDVHKNLDGRVVNFSVYPSIFLGKSYFIQQGNK